MMSRVQVVLAGVLSSAVCGILCAWLVAVSLVFSAEVGFGVADTAASEGVGDVVVGVLLLFVLAAIWGVAAGTVLGMGPTVVVVLAWGVLQARLGASGAVLAGSVLTGGVVVAEMLWLLREDGTWDPAAVLLAVATAAIAGACALVALRTALRATRARAATTY